MSLPAPQREELHFRRIDMRGYRRLDGLFEVEGRVVDQKPKDAPGLPGGRDVPANMPIHDLGVCIVFDARMYVREVRTFTNAAPYSMCPEGGRALSSLVGLRMAAGWSRQVRERLSRSASCTHLVELLMPLATVAMQSLGQLQRHDLMPVDRMGRPLKIDSCYAYRAESDLVRLRWPEYHQPPAVK